MARLAGVDIPREKRVIIALTYIYGVGKTRAEETLAATGIDPNIRVKDLSDEQLVQLRDHIEGSYKVEGDLRREVAADIRRKVEIGSYEGLRHRRGTYSSRSRRDPHDRAARRHHLESPGSAACPRRRSRRGRTAYACPRRRESRSPS